MDIIISPKKVLTNLQPLTDPPNAVRALRVARNLSCADIARRIGSDQATVSRFERHGIGMSRRKIQRMAEEVFELTPWQRIYDPSLPDRL